MIDEGAYRALTRTDKAGLLPVGIVKVMGNFGQQECVSLTVAKRRKKLSDLTKDEEPEYDVVVEEAGRALVNYTSTEIHKIMGRQSRDIEKLLGYADSEYVAYRDNTAFYDEKVDEP